MTSTLAAGPAFAEMTLGDIAVTFPGATAVFRRRKLDFCCGGRTRLADAVDAAALPAIEEELSSLDAEEAEVPQDTNALIAHIEERYHATHRRELPELIRLARRVEAVHQGHADAPLGLADLLSRMGWEMEAHMQKEEQGLFPMLREGMAVQMAMELMRDEHDDHRARLQELEALTHGHTPPAGACNSWRALYAGTAKFADDLVQHIHLENNVLFPRFGG